MRQEPAFLNILVQADAGHAGITLNRPDKMNPLDWDTIKELRTAVAALNADPAIRTVSFTGAGRAFSAGGDMEKYMTLFTNAVDFRAFMDDFYALFESMEKSSKIFVASVNGICVAGGLELLLACDLVIASADARIGDGHLNFGQLPGAGSSVRLWRAVGSIRAKHLMLTGEILSAADAAAMGLVGKVVPHNQLADATQTLVRQLHEKTPVGLAGAKKLLNNAVRSDLENALRAEIALVERYATTEGDAQEGLRAFRDKRKPRYAA